MLGRYNQFLKGGPAFFFQDWSGFAAVDCARPRENTTDGMREQVDPLMSSSSTISLFSERPEARRPPASFAMSILAHGLGLGAFSFAILYSPVIRDPAFSPRYTMRHLDIHPPNEQPTRAKGGMQYPGPRIEEKQSEAKKQSAAGGKPAAQLPQTAEAVKGPQTLLQPDLDRVVKLKQETPIPTAVIWRAKKQRVEKVVAPLPERVIAAEVKPSLSPPNEEVKLADQSIAATDLSAASQLVAPSTTSPLEVHGPEKAQVAPDTAVQSKETPNPAALLSLSDLSMQEGALTLAPVNESASQQMAGELMPGDASRKGAGNPESQADGVGSGTGEGVAARGGTGAQRGASVWPMGGPSEGTGTAGTTKQFSMPKDGQFGAVVVGASLEDRYPELAQLWGDRIAYTVYLHVGLEKSWILQYSLPRDAEAGGKMSRLEAPWPFNIVRPNLGAGAINADSLMVHGYVNQAGRFEDLAVAFPPEFAQAEFVLGALEQWQFRPSTQDGKNLRVEVLLIIPETN
jgi:hypothetical protein